MKTTINYIIIALIVVGAAVYFIIISYKQQVKNDVKTETPVNVGKGDGDTSNFKIIAAGDSLTAGYDLPLDDSYPKILEKKLIDAGKKVEVINAGVSGETTAGLLERAEFISAQNPDILLITIGGNDAFRNLPLSNTKENIEKAVRIFKQSVPADNIYLLQIEATANLGLGYRKEFNDIYKTIARAEKIKFLPFVVREVFLNQSRMLPDGIHPNREGYEFIVEKYIYPEISKKIAK